MAKKISKEKPAVKKTASKKTAKPSVKKAVVKKKETAKKEIKTKKKPVVKKSVTKKAVVKKVTSAKPKVSKSAEPKKIKKDKSKLTSRTKTGRKVEVVTTPAKPKVLKPIKGYSKKELSEFKEVILAKRTEIIEQLQNLKDQMMDETTGQYVNENSPYSLHMAEQGTDAQEREKLYLWAQRETKFLGYLEDALQRIDTGMYGICIDSLDLAEGPHLIPKNRLFAVPHTQHCVECKNKKNIF